MSINIKQVNKNDQQLVIRKKVNGLTYGDPGVPEWAMKEMEKDMGLPVSDNVVVYEENEMEKTQEQQTELVTTDQQQMTEVATVVDQEFNIELKKGQFLELLALVKTDGVSNELLLKNAKSVTGVNLPDFWVGAGQKVLAAALELRLFKQAA